MTWIVWVRMMQSKRAESSPGAHRRSAKIVARWLDGIDVEHVVRRHARAAECACEVVLLDLENGTADIGRMRGEERLDIPAIDRSSPFVTPVAADRIGTSQIPPVQPGCAVVLEIGAMVSGRRPERVELGKVRVALGSSERGGVRAIAPNRTSRVTITSRMCSTQGDFVPGEHLSQVRQVLLVASRRGRCSHAKLAHDERLQQRCDTTAGERKAEPELELHERTKLLVEPAERLRCRTPHDEHRRHARRVRQDGGGIQARRDPDRTTESVGRLHLDARGERLDVGGRAETPGHIAGEKSTEARTPPAQSPGVRRRMNERLD